MELYGNKYLLKKNLLHETQRSPKKIPAFNLGLIHKLFDTINISLLILIFILSFLSFDSQRKWSNIYKVLSNTRVINNNLIDKISKTEEFYILKLESLNTLKKTTPKDLIYLDKNIEKKAGFLNKNILKIINGIIDSEYQIGY